MIEMNVRHKRDMDSVPDIGERGCRSQIGNGNADEFTPGVLKLPDLGDRGSNIAGVRIGHRLNDDRSVSADVE